MTLTSALQSVYKDPASGEQPLNQCENIEEVLTDLTAELSQNKWVGITTCLRIDPNKLHLVSTANRGDLHRQKTLGLLCWIEEEPKNATFEKLISALTQVDAKALAGELRTFCRAMRMRRASRPTRKVESLQTQYYSMQFTQYPQVPKSAFLHNQWKFAELPNSHFLYASPAVAFYPSKSVPSHMEFDLTSSVSIHGSKLNLLHREAWSANKPIKQVHRPSTLSTFSSSTRKRALGNHKNSSQLEISTAIKTAIPLSKNLYQECHPEEVQAKIADKLFDYLLNTNGSKEVLAVITTLESIEGLVIKKLRKGSLKIETCLHRMSALKTLIKYFESGQLNDMFQELLISDTALKMAGAFAISLETNIDRNDIAMSMKEMQDKSRMLASNRAHNRHFVHSSRRSMSPPRTKNSFKTGPLPPYAGMQQTRVPSVPHSRSVMVDLSPSVRTVRPEPRSLLWKSEKNRNTTGKSDLQPGIIFSVDESQTRMSDNASRENEEDTFAKEKVTEGQLVPPPSPDLQDKDANEVGNNEEAVKHALDDLNKRTTEAEEAYKYFDESTLRHLVNLLKKAPEFGIDTIGHVGDLRKYATILRKNDAADTAQLVEKYVKVTESLDQIHRDVMSKIWLKLSDNTSASAKSRASSGSLRRSPLRNRVTQSIEIWRQMQDPKYDFTKLETSEHLPKTFTDEELDKYGGLLSHIPALLSSAKTCHQLLNHYMHAP